jgi:hypothetical protein
MPRARIWLLVTVLAILSMAGFYAVPARADQLLVTPIPFGSAAAVDSEGNLIVVGSSQPFSNGASQEFMFKFVSSLPASPISQRACMSTFGNGEPLDTFGYGVATDSSDNFYITGTTQTFGGEDYDVFVQKFTSSCTLLYTLQWGGPGNDIPRGIAVDGEDNVYIAGTTNSFSNGYNQIFLIKYNPEGGLQFSSRWGGLRNDYGAGLAVDPFGNVYVVGTTTSYGTGQSSSIVLLKYDSFGNLLFQRTLGGPLNSFGAGVAVDTAGYVYVTGYSYSLGPTPGTSAVVLLKYDQFGNLIFQKTWGGTLDDFATGIAVDLDDNVYLVGYTKTFSISPHIPSAFFLKFDQNGNLILQKIWGGNRPDYAFGVAVDRLENAYVTGYTYSFGPNSQGASFFVLKYDITGSLLYQKIYGGGIPDP